MIQKSCHSLRGRGRRLGSGLGALTLSLALAFGFGLVAALALALRAPDARAGGRVDPGLRPPKQVRTKHPTLGDPKAPVTVMVFGSYQCPYTAMVMRTLAQLVKDHPRKVKVVWRDFPLAFHRESRPAALAGREVFRQKGSAAFFAFQQLVFANQRGITDAQLSGWAVQVGANGARVLGALQDAGHQKGLQEDMAEGQGIGVRGTPASYVFGRHGSLRQATHIGGSVPYDKFKTAVDAL